ncbi:MAG: hypothetical protein KVP17_001436 [Porospora cf. gigantea B]|uniref:uncharacterized protein n=1 Tax=Porospora cf. gigantea B TaxID=2853592 RepID=UPI003571F696|nr:MAG: hypothetical protein KVP17_001436 [Porospora cf. gigantea B]
MVIRGTARKLPTTKQLLAEEKTLGTSSYDRDDFYIDIAIDKETCKANLLIHECIVKSSKHLES